MTNYKFIFTCRDNGGKYQGFTVSAADMDIDVIGICCECTEYGNHMVFDF